jgi:hypothetical protein
LGRMVPHTQSEEGSSDLAVALPANTSFLQAADDPRRPAHLRPSGKAFQILTGLRAALRGHGFRNGLFPQAAGILQAVRLVGLEHGQDIPVMFQA